MTRWSAMIDVGGPSAITLPWAITMTQSEMSRTMSMSCSTNRTVIPSSRSAFTWPSRLCFRAGFTPAIGSSSMTSSGLTMRARAISRSFRWPPDSEPAKSFSLASSLNRTSSSRAGVVFSASWLRHRNENGPAQNCSPSCPVAPSRMFSSTVSFERTLVSWNVRTMPRRATWEAETFFSDLPLKDQSPVLGRSKPVSRLKNVVLPAPLGPIRAVITPRWISTCSTSTAVSPPKVRVMLSATTMGSGLGTPGSVARPASAAAPRRDSDVVATGVAPVLRVVVWSPGTSAEVSAGIERDLLLVSEETLRAEDHQQHQDQSHDGEADVADLVGAHQAWRDDRVVAVGQPGQELPEEGQQPPEEDRSDHRRQHPGRAAEDQHREGDEGEVEVEAVGLHGREAHAADEPSDGADQAAEDQGLHLVGVDVLAERAHGVLVLADALEHPAPRRLHQ